MKNIHILPTDKPSKLWLSKVTNNLNTGKPDLESGICKFKNIYITSDEEIKVRDYVLDEEQDVFQVLEINHITGILRSNEFTSIIDVCKKIILATDQSLDGIQAIDDEFLEWFVQNPSCERVDVEWVDFSWSYFIIIPKELKKLFYCSDRLELDDNEKCIIQCDVCAGKSKQVTSKKIYSEEEVLTILHKRDMYKWQDHKEILSLTQWFEQFKKK